MTAKKHLSQRHKLFYFLSIWEKRIVRFISWYIDEKKYSKTRTDSKLKFMVHRHSSKLLKKLGDSEMYLQYNKVDNLRIVVSKLNGLLIKPGETFSFCKMVGYPSKIKGYKEGMELSFGKAKTGIGGGICQSSNLIHWMALHSPLTISERHHHSFDPFPDDGRVLPWASGATVFYNYLDLQITNNTLNTFQLNLWLTDDKLEGELRCSQELEFKYDVYEKNNKFIKKGAEYFRTNEIWRNIISDSDKSHKLRSELLYKNFGKVMYVPDKAKDDIEDF